LEVAALAANDGASCSAYGADGIAPTVIGSTLKKFDLDTGKITLSFSEIMDRKSYVAAKFYFKSFHKGIADNDSEESRKLTGGTVDESADAIEFTITLNDDDLDYIKGHELCTRLNSCYLKLEAGGFKDHADNMLAASETNPGGFFGTDSFVDDNTKPTVAQWSLNMDTSEIAFTFSEPINFNTITRSAITLMEARSSAGSKTLTLASCVDNAKCAENPSSRVVSFAITSDDLNTIKKNQFCTSSSNCYLSFTKALITDTSRQENAILAVEAASAVELPAGGHTADATDPKIGDFSFDLEKGQVHLTFNEPVQPATVRPAKIVLQGTKSSADPKLELKGTSKVVEEIDGVAASLTITITMTATDVVSLKENAALFKDRSNSFLSMDAGTVKDMVGHDVVVVAVSDAKQATDFLADKTPGKLTSYVLDHNTRELWLTFDEVMDVSTFKAKELTLQPVDTMEGVTDKTAVTLTDTLVKGGDAHADSGIVVLALSVFDQVAIGKNTALGTETSNTFITMTAACIDDLLGRDVIAISDGKGLPAGTVTLDTTDPKIKSSVLDLEAETLTVVFDEPMKSEGFTGTALSLQATASGGASRTLESTAFKVTENTFQDTFVLTLVDTDLDAIKLAATLGVVDADDNALVTTYIVTTTGLHTDFNGKSVTEITTGAAKAVDTLTVDATSPNLDSFKIDMDNGEITLTFDEPILASSVDPKQFIVQDKASASVEHPLTGGDKSSTNGREITITMTVDDLNAIKGKAMASGKDNTFIRMAVGSDSKSAATDMTAVAVTALADGSAKRCKDDGYTADTSRPTIDSFAFNLNAGTIVLEFSETASADSITLDQFTIQSDAQGTISKTLSSVGATKSQTDSTSITITLADADLNFIKADTGLASDKDTTYLKYTADAAEDVSGNDVTPSTGTLVKGGGFTKDVTHPELSDFSINMNTGTVTLSFSEAVNAAQFDETAITLQSAADGNDGTTVTIASLGTAKSKTKVDSKTVSFVLADADLDVIKYSTGFATSDSNVFISFTAAMIQDMASTNARSVVAILLDAGKVSKPGSFVPDTTPPEVSSFTFDLDDSKLVMTMSEPMGTSFDVTKLTLKDATGQATHTPSLLSSVARSGATGKTVTVSFHGDDLDFIKALPLLAVSDASTVLTLTTDFAVDTTGVQIKALTSIDNKTPASNGGYGEDTKHPNLTGFVLDLKTNTLRLTFDETVKADGINLNGIRLLASKGATDADEIYQLQTDKNNVQCART